MKSFLSCIFFGLFFVTLSAQQGPVLALAQPDSVREAATSKPADRFMPSLANGGLLTFLYQQLEYPDIAAENGAEGTVVIALTVDETGKIIKREIVRSVPLLDQAALNATQALPPLLPAVENGKAVARKLHIPILFRLR